MDTTQYYNQLNPYFDPQRAVIAQQRAALEPQMQSQISALEQAKINAYRDIGTTARARGMQFSGFSPEQEARYTGATYLPALANVRSQYAAGMTALDKALADIGLAQGTQALNIYQTEKTRAQEQEQWQREMDWKSAQAELDRQLERQRIAASRSSSSSSQQLLQTYSQIAGALNQAAGTDGYVHPTDYKAARSDAARQGISGEDFDKYYGGYINPSHGGDYGGYGSQLEKQYKSRSTTS